MQFKTYISVIIIFFFTSLLAPQGKIDTLIFSHQMHLEGLELDCDICHESVYLSLDVSDKNLPDMDICMDCHDGDTASNKCSVCHTNPKDPQPVLSKEIPALIFSHKLHLEKNTQCLNCHKDIAKSSQNIPSNPIEMKLCMECHDPPKTEAECYLCHRSLKGKSPLSHTPLWKKTHGIEATLSEEGNCSICHQQSQCEDCHTRQQFEKRVHPIDFDVTHGLDYLSFTIDCSSCHEMPVFCSYCHRQQSIMPLSHNGVFWASLKMESGGNHGSEALDNPDYCMLCHEDPATDITCQRCHGK